MPIDQSTLESHVNPVFIETGTYMGKTIDKALAAGFERVISIEIDEHLHKQAKAKFAGDARVELLFGDTVQLLPDILRSLEDRATFWLDAHRSGPLLGGYIPYPIMQELAMIEGHAIKDHTILIDDRRLIPTEWQMHEAEVHAAIMKINPAYRISYANGVIPNDVIVAAALAA